MKTIVRLFVIFACMLATMAQAQVTTTITPKVQLFPSSGLSYVEDPTQYFNVIMTNTGPERQLLPAVARQYGAAAAADLGCQ